MLSEQVSAADIGICRCFAIILKMDRERQLPLPIDEAAKKIWDYMLLKQPLEQADIIIALGCGDESVAERGASLYQDGYASLVLVSGGTGPKNKQLSSGLWTEPTEAEHFAKIILQRGVPTDKLLVERESTNTGENLAYSYELLRKSGLEPKSIIFIHKPHLERRILATTRKQWPNQQVKIQITSYPFTYEEYTAASNAIAKEETINSMVGSLQRIREYPKLGYQIEQTIPEDVWQAYEFLISKDYDKRLLRI